MKLEAKDGVFDAHLNEPAAPHGAIVLVHEIFGVTAKIRGYADDYASSGFRVLAPDLFWRVEPNVELGHREPDLSRALERLKLLEDGQALDDIAVCVQWLRQRSPGLPVSIVGFCLGGRLAVSARMQGMADAYVAYYGVGIDHVEGDLAQCDAPLLMHYGAEDDYVKPETVAGFAGSLGNHSEIRMYDGAGHAFYRPGKDAASDLSRRRTLDFLPTSTLTPQAARTAC